MTHRAVLLWAIAALLALALAYWDYSQSSASSAQQHTDGAERAAGDDVEVEVVYEGAE
jgi:hypothetical protein